MQVPVGEPAPGPTMTADLVAVAQRCRDRCVHDAGWPPSDVASLAALEVVLDEGFCCDVADRFERASPLTYDDGVAFRYGRMKQENLRHYEEILDAGIAI